MQKNYWRIIEEREPVPKKVEQAASRESWNSREEQWTQLAVTKTKGTVLVNNSLKRKKVAWSQ